MKKVILSLGLMLCAMQAMAQDTSIQNMPYGSGTPGTDGSTAAVETYPGSGLYYAPGYMPGYPTAGVIFPRVIDVNCNEKDHAVVCDGYNWLPAMGRGEYLFIRPRLVKSPEVKTLPPVIIYKEVPTKKGKQ